MHIISRRRLREFWENDKQAETALNEWYRRLKRIEPESLADIRRTFPQADLVGKCVVFNIGGNKYRLITRIDLRRKVVYIRYVLTHSEYDKEKWKADCL